MKTKKCKICKSPYEKRNIDHMVCGYECSLKYAQKSVNKKAKEKKTEARVELKAFNNSDKSVLKKNTQMLVNKYARLKDYHENGLRCVTCDSTAGKRDGGHFLPTSGYSAIRYNVNQIHQQCVNCNQYNGGRYKEYRVFMIDKYGLEYVEKLEATKSELRSYSVEYYQRLIKILRVKIRRIERNMV